MRAHTVSNGIPPSREGALLKSPDDVRILFACLAHHVEERPRPLCEAAMVLAHPAAVRIGHVIQRVESNIRLSLIGNRCFQTDDGMRQLVVRNHTPRLNVLANQAEEVLCEVF